MDARYPFIQTDNQYQIQLELFQDYKTNLGSYQSWQKFLRTHQFPTLLVWGKNGPVFMGSGAETYLKDLPNAELHLLDAGDFAVEEKPVEIAKYIVTFIDQLK